MRKVETHTHVENWRVCNELLASGFNKIADCMWSKIFKHPVTDTTVIVNLSY